MKKRRLVAIVLVLGILLLAGCATGNGVADETKEIDGRLEIAEQSSQTQSDEAEKKLTGIIVYWGDGSTEVCDVLYNEKGQVTSFANLHYQYDLAGRLVKVTVYDRQYKDMANGKSLFTYNENGQLIEEYHQGGGEGRFLHEYDSEGRKIKTTVLLDGLKEEEVFAHDSLGRPVSSVITCTGGYGDEIETWTETAEYFWNEQGRPADGIYHYKSIVIYKDCIYPAGVFYATSPNAAMYSHYDHYLIFSTPDPEIIADEDGYVMKIIGEKGKISFEFVYDSVSGNE